MRPRPAQHLANRSLTGPGRRLNRWHAVRIAYRSLADVATPQDPQAYPVVQRREVAAPGWLATMDAGFGAGFYSNYAGPLPLRFGSVPPHEYVVRQRARR
jgi:hypothetical protein